MPGGSVYAAGSGSVSRTKRKREEHKVDGSAPVTSPRKTKGPRTLSRNKSASDAPVSLACQPKPPAPGSKRRKRGADDGVEMVREEKRLRSFRKKPPQSYITKLTRATLQRMFIVKRQREETTRGPEETVHIVGTTGNIYKVVIGKVPACSCPDAMKGNQCKHIVYVLCNVLKVKDYLRYQLAFLSSELREIFEKAPINPADSSSTGSKGKQKPIDGDCPICFMPLDSSNDQVVWCKAACGNNIHRLCFEQWAASLNGKQLRCVYCRTPWEDDGFDIHSLLSRATISEDGYINVAEAMGLSQERGRGSSLLFNISSALGAPTIVSLLLA
ncbi:uncharacterized protein CIMG_04170 [Coccidioides immitis RS]|uniref:RING finger domain-containing protein n=1 Tax=Coccidioides immitis (strain RS) TaxID=246410 RepID=J3KCX8_COCIM|nr:uncharacterized protein CIMG_04170 [Coccidioides immitis RS]EAS33146.3 hypothetical protein CIMG_04170 [Coccidioides immitis RS]